MREAGHPRAPSRKVRRGDGHTGVDAEMVSMDHSDRSTLYTHGMDYLLPILGMATTKARGSAMDTSEPDTLQDAETNFKNAHF